MNFEVLFNREKNELVYIVFRVDGRFGKLAVFNKKTKEFAIKDVRDNGSMAYEKAIKEFDKGVVSWNKINLTSLFKEQAQTAEEFVQMYFHKYLCGRTSVEPKYPVEFGWREDFENVPENKLIIIAIEDEELGYLYFTGHKVGTKFRFAVFDEDGDPDKYEAGLQVNLFEKRYWMELHDVQQ